jgi:hypothetical protein
MLYLHLVLLWCTAKALETDGVPPAARAIPLPDR